MLARQTFAGGIYSPVREFISNHILVYKAVAFMNMFTQGIVILGCLFFKKPYFRLFFGVLFALEALGLYVVMGRFPSILPFNFDWLLLLCIFIDWDFFFKKFKKAPAQNQEHAPIKSYRIYLLSVIILFNSIVTYITLGRDHPKLYPFSSNAMFSYTLAKQPYDVHQSFETFAVTYYKNNKLVTPDSLLSSKLYPESYFYKFDSPIEIEKFLTQKKQTIDENDTLMISQSLFKVPPYPNPSKAKIVFSEAIGSIDRDGAVSYIHTEYDKNKSTLEITNKNMPTGYNIEFIKRKITYDYLTTLGKKHSKVIKNIGDATSLKTKALSSTTYKIIESLTETHLISVKITYPDQKKQVYRGPLISNE